MPADFTYRLASSTDNDAILAFMASQPMSAGISLRFDRSPDFFALAKAHGLHFETHLIELDGRIRALASLVVRDGFIDGRLEKVVYLCDLRVHPHRALAGCWRRLFVRRMRELANRYGSRYAFTAIIRDNLSARNALLGNSRFGFQRLRGYSTTSILAHKPFAKRTTDQITIRRADHSSFHEIQHLLDSFSRQQPFGVDFGGGELTRRLIEWPALEIENFLMAEDANGNVLGCLAPWDYSSVKRVVIDSLPRSVEALRQLINLAAPLTGRPVVKKPPGAVLPDIALTHVAIVNRRVEVFSALLREAVAAIYAQKQFATISLCLFDDDPLWAALDEYWHHSVPMDVYSLGMTPDAPPLSPPGDSIPGFEFYLA